MALTMHSTIHIFIFLTHVARSLRLSSRAAEMALHLLFVRDISSKRPLKLTARVAQTIRSTIGSKGLKKGNLGARTQKPRGESLNGSDSDVHEPFRFFELREVYQPMTLGYNGLSFGNFLYQRIPRLCAR